MTPAVAYAIAIATAVVAGWLVPALAIRALVPSLEASALVTENYRGRTVALGLGLVWAAWSVSLFVASTALDAVASLADIGLGSAEMLLFDGPLTMPLYAVPIILTVSAVLFGMVDDVFGTSADKGFRGHLRALVAGRLSTGGLKLLGIGLIAAVYGWRAAVQGAESAGVTSIGVLIGWWVAATLVIALSANLLNLTDLRPGRALKSYSVLAVAAGVVFSLDVAGRYESYATDLGVVWVGADTAVTVACMLIVLLGPVLAVWPYDLGERGMLGDAGSNAMGAVVGYLLAGSLDLPTLAAVAVVLVGLNALSERVSFSAVIEAVPPLRYLDGLGRLREVGDGTEEAGTGGP
ncbi:MAG: hypothetical protein Q7W51_09295 [Coriobacteriia bacterium]|nr:hypothetical protein [Coriobacteriia bacterium]